MALASAPTRAMHRRAPLAQLRRPVLTAVLAGTVATVSWTGLGSWSSGGAAHGAPAGPPSSAEHLREINAKR